ncbi:LysR family transcriptional regulator [Dechloromonas sp. A34]|uniref:LysR family transcriptional regulator n=1 Tax=Dechloromonas sp. A34 TaxID=447588 RepID=UPI002248E838|nr:LysR family transcriptional regulator [Dechloromonas sp. A34]
MVWLGSWEAFAKVVECGSMAAAARRLDCTRAQVSKQIGELERAFGVRLFERSTRKLSLTPSGEIFHQHALQALEAVQSAEIAVKNQGDAPRGVLRISASITFGRMYIAPLLPRLIARYPELRCELVLTDQLVDLIDDNIDLALRMTKAPPEDAVAKKLVALKRVICGTPAYFAAHGTPKTPQELAGHTCFSYLLGDGERVWRMRNRQGEEISVPVGSAFQFNNVDCIVDAVLAGHGLAILPTYLFNPERLLGRLLSVLDDFEPISSFGQYLHACYTPSRVRAPKVRAFLAELENEFDPLPPWEKLGADRLQVD